MSCARPSTANVNAGPAPGPSAWRIGFRLRLGLVSAVVAVSFTHATSNVAARLITPPVAAAALAGATTGASGSPVVRVVAHEDGRVLIEARNPAPTHHRPSDEEVDYTYRAGLHEAALAACAKPGHEDMAGANGPTQDYAYSEDLSFYGTDISMAWKVACGASGRWMYPGERAAAAPLGEYIRVMEDRVARLDKVRSTSQSRITVYVPGPTALVKAYGHDLTSREGHKAILQQRMMAASAVARMRQSGAFSQVDVEEYDDTTPARTMNGLVLAPRPWQLSYVQDGERIATFNPATQWDHYMRRPVSAYEDRLAAAGDSAAMFAYKVGR